MQTLIVDSPAAVGQYAGAQAAALLNEALYRAERARLLLATGQSQLELLQDLVRRPVEWARVDAFHLDEYVGLDPSHPASFRRYLRELVADIVPVAMHYVDPDSPDRLARLSALVDEAPMDVALVGIGENGHIAFNDPPPTSPPRRPTSPSSSTRAAVRSRSTRAGSHPSRTCRSGRSPCPCAPS